MVESYNVSAELAFKSNLPAVLRELQQGFEAVNRMVSELREGLGGLASGTRGLGRLSKTLAELREARLSSGLLADMSRLTELQEAVTRSAAESARAYREAASAARSIRPHTAGEGGEKGTSGRRVGHSHVSGLDAAIGAQQLGDSGLSLVESMFKAAAEAGQLVSQFQQNTSITPKDLDAIKAKADALTTAVPGTTITENLHTILDAYTVVGNINEALAASGALAKLRMVFTSLPGEHHGDTSFAAAQAVEVMQRYINPTTHQVDLDALTKQMNAMARVAVGTGGRVTGASYLGFAKQARLGGMLANDEFLYGDLPALLISLGGNRAGTGDAATYRQFIQGRMTANAFQELQRFGLVDQRASWKLGQVRDMRSHLAGADEFIRNPAAWVRDVLLPQLRKNGINTNDRAAVGTGIGQWASTATGLGFLLEYALGMPGVLKEKAKIQATSGDPFANILANDPMQKLREFQAAQQNLLTTLGTTAMGPAIEVLKGLTKALNDFSDWAKKNPDDAKHLVVVAGGLSAVAAAAGSVATTIYLGAPIILGMRALGVAAGALGAPVTGPLALVTAGVLAWHAALTTLIPAVESVFKSLNNQLGVTGHPFANMRGGHGGADAGVPASGGIVHKEAWQLPTGQPGVIQLTSYTVLDGKVLARSTAKYMAADMRAANGPTFADIRAAPSTGGATGVAI